MGTRNQQGRSLRPGPSTFGLLGLLLLLGGMPARAASALAAWQINRQGQLELRTSPGVQVKAFYEAGSGSTGPRIWFDLPGAPQNPRSIRGRGALREVRIGKPNPYTTRLVLEFQRGTRLDPRQLRLVGTARDRWRMDLRSLPPRSLVVMGEGNINAPTPSWSRGSSVARSRVPSTYGRPLSLEGLPSVPRGRYRVVIDPGHGGPDPGAVGIGGLRETDIVLDVGLQVAQLLQAKGVQVLMTRTSEVDVDLPPRVSLANRSRANVFVSLHANALSMSRPDVNGIETFYFRGGNSYALAATIQSQLMAVSPGTPNRGARPGRFYVIRRTVMPSALAEMGFVTGEIDAPRLRDPRHRRRLAQAVASAILSYLQRS